MFLSDDVRECACSIGSEYRPGSLQRFRQAEQGSTLIEFTLLLPVLLTILLTATELAMYMQRSILVVEAASVGARYGIVAGNASDTAGMIAAATNEAEGISGFTATATTFCSCSPGGSKVDCSTICNSSVRASHYVQVATSAKIPGIFNIPGLPTSMQPSAQSTMRASWAGN